MQSGDRRMVRPFRYEAWVLNLLLLAACAEDEKAPNDCTACYENDASGNTTGDAESSVCTQCTDASGSDMDGGALDASEQTTADGSDISDSSSQGSDASQGDAAVAMNWPTGPIRPTRLRIPDPPITMPPCAGGNGKVSGQEILLGQTHLTPRDWPFQTVSANRPLTVAVAAAGTGAAPAMTATAKLDGKSLTLCLTGAANLGSDMSDVEARTYRGTLPAAWVKPGLSVDVAVAGKTETLTVDVKAENGLTLYLVAAQLFGSGTPKVANEAELREYLAHLPFSYLDVGANPFGVWSPTRLLMGPRDDSRTPAGDTTSTPAMLLSELPHCSSADKTAGKCSPNSGFGTMSAVLGALDTFREANGVGGISTWYAHHAVGMGGGLAGGQRGTGDDLRFTMNHELGHAWGFPHWDTSHTDYPYEGVQRNNGGFGDRWALHQITGKLKSPRCGELERQSPMQRASCAGDNPWPDPYSDYESARLLRMNLGAAQAKSGTVAYLGGVKDAATRSYNLPKETGRSRMVWSSDKAGFALERYDEATNSFVAQTSTDWNRIAQSEVPVLMFSGAVIVGQESFFEKPIEYVGNVLHKLDPSDAQDYKYVYDHRSSDFYWAHDVSLRFTLDDGTSFYRLYAGGKLRADGEHMAFAFNLPADVGKRVKKLEVISRPLGWYDTTARLSASDNAGSFYSKARVVATWTRP